MTCHNNQSHHATNWLLIWSAINPIRSAKSSQEFFEFWNHFNSSPPRAAYMRHRVGSVLVQIMAYAYSTPNQYQSQCWVIVNRDLGTNFSGVFIKIQSFSCKKIRLAIPSAKWWPFYPGRDQSNQEFAIYWLPQSHGMQRMQSIWWFSTPSVNIK